MGERTAKTKCIAAATGLVAIATSLGGAMAEPLSPTSVFEGKATTLGKNETLQTIRINVQSWGIEGNDRTEEIPLRGFYVAHMISGRVLATIDGQAAEHLPGDYWTIKAGGAMQVKVLGEVTVLETIVVAKQ
jgi:hypothetical protein